MSVNQYGVGSMWLLILIILFAVVLHYSVTLQYSAYFHIYFKISKKYEEMLHTSHKSLKPHGKATEWIMGITKDPFRSKDDDEEEEEDPSAALRRKKAALKVTMAN